MKADIAEAATEQSRVHPPVRMRTKFFGFFSRTERWGLSIRGWIVLLLALLLGAALFVTRIYPFLAETNRVPTDILVIEGWVHECGIRAAIQEFSTGHYTRVFTTGGAQTGSGTATGPLAADVIADWLSYRGIPKDVLQPVPSRTVGRDRTYSSAVDLRDWLREHQMDVRSLNVISETVHARRTHLLYRKAFGEKVAVGIVAAPSPDYDARRWWNSSDGFRDVVSELVAYVYARTIFSTDKAGG